MSEPRDMQFASAFSDREDPDSVMVEVVDQLAARLGDEADICWLFVTMEYADALAEMGRQLREALNGPVLLGCTCAGLVAGEREIEQGAGVSVLAGTLGGATTTVVDFDPSAWPQGDELATQVTNAVGGTQQLRAVVMLADPFSTPLVTMLPQMNESLPGVPIVGGMASGGDGPRTNRLLLNDQLVREGAIAVALHGNIHVQTTVSQGARPIGSPLVITKAKRHVVQQLGGHGALEVLRDLVQTLDADEQQLVQSHGVLIGRVVDEYKPRFGRGDFVIRGLVGVDPKAGYLAIGDPQVRVGQTIQFHVRDAQTATDDFLLLLEAQRVHGPAAGAILFTCNGRGKALFDQPDADASMVADALNNAPMAGFFAAGEIGPLGSGNYVHGHTASLIVFRPGREGSN